MDIRMDSFWQECKGRGVMTKRLVMYRTPESASPWGLRVVDAVKHGAPLISVPYDAVLNGQTLRGDLLPRALPPLRKSVLFLTRRGRVGTVAAHSLWLAAFLACSAAVRTAAKESSPTPRDALLSSAVYPPLPNLFAPQHAPACASLRHLSPPDLQEAAHRVAAEVHLTHSLLQHYARRRGVPRALCPSTEALTLAYRTVMQRAVLLPWNCEPSAPGDIAELIASSPEIALLPSLVPIIDMIQPAPPSEEEEKRRGGSSNCLLFTCEESDFVSSTSRRRVIVETAPLASRRVVVCAARQLKEGEELLMDFE